jgi:hypothetical protein
VLWDAPSRHSSPSSFTIVAAAAPRRLVGLFILLVKAVVVDAGSAEEWYLTVNCQDNNPNASVDRKKTRRFAQMAVDPKKASHRARHFFGSNPSLSHVC